jgi:WD40 repeat protein
MRFQVVAAAIRCDAATVGTVYSSRNLAVFHSQHHMCPHACRSAVGAAGVLIVGLFATVCVCEEPGPVAAPDIEKRRIGNTEPGTPHQPVRLLSRSQFELGVVARDAEHDPIKAAHYFLHAGLNAAAADDQQLAIDASHAAQDVVGAVDFSFPHQAPVGGAAVSPGGGLLCSWSYEGRSVHIWSLETGAHVRSLELPTGVGWVRFHPRRHLLLIGAYNAVVIWPFDRDEPANQFDPNAGTRTGSVPWARFHPDGESVVASEGKVRLRWTPGSTPEKLTDSFSQVLLESPFRRQGDTAGTPRLVAQVVGQQVRVWDLQTGKSIRSVHCNGPVLQTLVNPHSRELLTWHGTLRQSTMQIWSLDAAELEPLHGDNAWSAPGRVVLSPTGRHAASWGEAPPNLRQYGRRITSKSLDVWSCAERRFIGRVTLDSLIRDARFDPSGEYLVAWSDDGTVSLWSLREGKIQRLIQWPFNSRVESIVFHPTEPQVLVVTTEHIAQLFAISDHLNSWGIPRESTPLRQFPGSVRDAVFTANGGRLITWGAGRVVRVWNLNHGVPRPLVRTTTSIGSTPIVRWLNGDRFVAGGYPGQPLCVWSLKESEALWQSPMDSHCYLHSASSNGEHLIVRRTKRPTPSARPRRERPVPEDLPEPRPRIEQYCELWSIHEAEPLKTWPVEDGIRGRLGFRFLDDQRYLAWQKHDLRLEEPGRNEPLRQWKVSRWFSDVVPFSDGRRLLVTTNTNRYDEGEILVLSFDGDEPLLRVTAERDFLRARLLPDESGMLVWHKSRRPVGHGPAFARLHYFDAQRPTVTIENFQPRDLEAVDFDRQCRFIVGSRFDSRLAWLWSAETGKLLHKFHRRGAEQSGFDEHYITFVKIDPQARFAVTLGGTSPRMSGNSKPSMKFWSLKDFQPIADFTVPNGSVVAVRDDGTVVWNTGQEVWLLSPSGHPAPLRRLRTSYGVKQCLQHPKTGAIYAVNRLGEIFDWTLTTWRTDELKRELQQLERRTAQVLDSRSGQLRLKMMETVASRSDQSE